MTGRQKSKKVVSVVDEQADSAEKAENITASSKLAMASSQNMDEDLRAIGLLADARIDNPRVISISPKDKSLILGKFDVRSERSSAHKQKFLELKSSMQHDGQQRPIIAAPRGKELWVVAGNTRVEAARKGGLSELFVLKTDLTDKQAWYLSLLTNLDNRLPVLPLTEEEEGAAIEKLITDYNWSQRQIATHLHRHESWVSRRRRIMKVDPELDRAVQEGPLSSSHLEAIITLPKCIQGEVAGAVQYYDDDGNEQLLSVVATQKMVNAVKPFVKGKTPEEINEWTFSDDCERVLDPENYLEKDKSKPTKPTTQFEQEEKASPAKVDVSAQPPSIVSETAATSPLSSLPTSAAAESAEPQEGISEQLFGKHVSGDVPADVAAAAEELSGKPLGDSSLEAPVSPEDPETAENLDSIAPTKYFARPTASEEAAALTEVASATGVKTSIVQRVVNKAGSTVLEFVCPCCDEPLVLDLAKMIANWKQDLEKED